jgi:hypothetical protein
MERWEHLMQNNKKRKSRLPMKRTAGFFLFLMQPISAAPHLQKFISSIITISVKFS